MRSHQIIPTGWSVKKLQNVGDLKNGINKDSSDFGFGVPFVNLIDVFGKHELNCDEFGLVNANEKDIVNYSLEVGDILFVRSSVKPTGVGLTSVVKRVPNNTVYSGFLIRLRPLPKLLSHEFSKYCFLESNFRKNLLRCSTISANTNINQETLSKLEVLLPPFSEQDKIANIINCWDSTINLMERLIATKQERRMWLMQQLLTGKRRLPGVDGEWREVHLRDIFTRVQRSIPDGKNPEVLSITAKVGFVSQREKFSKVIAGKNLEQYVFIRKGEFSYNKGNSLTYPQGCIFRLKEFDEGAVPNVFLSFRAASPEVCPDFYSHFFSSGGLNHQLSRVINTGVRNDGLLNLNARDFFGVKVPFPPLVEQEKIAKTLSVANEEIDLLRAQLDALREQKKGLMQQLLTGKVRVKVLS